jgi:hypothetical protein
VALVRKAADEIIIACVALVRKAADEIIIACVALVRKAADEITIPCVALVRKAADEIIITNFFKSFGVKPINELAVTTDKLNNFMGLITSSLGPDVAR